MSPFSTMLPALQQVSINWTATEQTWKCPRTLESTLTPPKTLSYPEQCMKQFSVFAVYYMLGAWSRSSIREFCIGPSKPFLKGILSVGVQSGSLPLRWAASGSYPFFYSVPVKSRKYQIIMSKLYFYFRKLYFQIMLCKK